MPTSAKYPVTTPKASTPIGTAHKSDFGDKDEALIETFVSLRFNGLLGKASKEWQRIVEKSPRLANGEYPLELAKIIETALVRCAVSWDYN